MVQCNMCGKEVEQLFNAIIEKTELKVCNECLKLGKLKKENNNKFDYHNTYSSNKKSEENYEERLVFNPGKLIKKAREEKNMRQIDLAKMLQIKDSYLQHIENGDMALKMNLARQIEDALNITLIKKFKSAETFEMEKQSSGMTLGDLIKIKIRK